MWTIPLGLNIPNTNQSGSTKWTFLQTKPGQGTCFPYYICRPFSGQPIGSKLSVIFQGHTGNCGQIIWDLMDLFSTVTHGAFCSNFTSHCAGAFCRPAAFCSLHTRAFWVTWWGGSTFISFHVPWGQGGSDFVFLGSSTSVSTAVPSAGNPDGPAVPSSGNPVPVAGSPEDAGPSGSNSEVVPSAGKPSQTLCWASCLAPGWSCSKSSSRLSIMWLITTALLGPSSAEPTVPDGTSIPVAGGGLPGHSTFIELLLLLLLLLLSPGAQAVPSLVGGAFFRPSPEGDFGDFGDLGGAFLGLGWWVCCTTKSSINHLTLFLNCLTLMPVPSNQGGYCRL